MNYGTYLPREPDTETYFPVFQCNYRGNVALRKFQYITEKATRKTLLNWSAERLKNYHKKTAGRRLKK